MNITTHTDGHGVIRLALAGTLDMATEDQLDQRVTQTIAETRPGSLVIDAADLAFCDSSGIHALLRARDAAHRHGAAFQLTNPRGIARRALEITGLLTSLTTLSRV